MLIKDMLQNSLDFSSSERQIADFILARPEEFISMSIRDVSGRLYVSRSTIIRFAKKLGFSGHRDLCLTLAKELPSLIIKSDRLPETLPFSGGDSDKTIAEKILMVNFQALTDTYSFLNLQQLRAVADQIAEKERVVLFGMIESFLVASDFQYKLMNIGIDAILPTIPGMYFRQGCNVKEGDLAFIISFYGKHAETVQLVRTLKECGARIILLTGPGNSPLIPYANEIIRVNVNESHPKIGAISSRTAMMFVTDIIYSFIFSAGYEKNKRYIAERAALRMKIRGEQ